MRRNRSCRAWSRSMRARPDRGGETANPAVAGGSSQSKSLPLAVLSYGQVFEDALPQQLIGAEPSSGLAAAVTCWGDGKVNLRRAPDAVIEQACQNDVGAMLSGSCCPSAGGTPTGHWRLCWPTCRRSTTRAKPD